MNNFCAHRSAAPLTPSPLDAWLAAQCNGTEQTPLPQRIAATQLQEINTTIAHAAANSRWYARTLAHVSHPLQQLEDMTRLPFTLPQDITDYRDFLCIPQGDVQRIVTLQTSGSTGTPKRLAFSAQDLARTATFFAVGMQQLVRANQRLLVLLPGAQRPDGVTDVLRQALTPLNVQVYAGQPQATPQSLWADITRHTPHCLVAAPHQLQALLDAVQSTPQLLQAAQCVEAIQSSGDVLDTKMRDTLEHLLVCRILDHYGMTETGFGGGVQCQARCGYHMRELDVFIEIIDPNGTAPVPAGSVGEIVLTTLHRDAMPLIRYRTGDAAAWIAGPCPCGSSLRRLSALAGRYCLENGTFVLHHVRKGDFDARNHPTAL